MDSINVKTIKDLIGKKDLFELHSFLEFNSIDINDVPKQKIDPLTYAIEIEAPDTVILFLIEKYHTLNYETDQGKIPIFCALEHQNFKIAEALLKGKKNGVADLNYINRQKQTILTYLYYKNKLSKKVLKYCIERGVNVNIQWSKKESVLTQIIHGKREGFEDIIKSLIYTTVYTNDFIVLLLTYGKTRKKVSESQFQNLIHDEKAKLNITKSVYKCVIDNGCINLLSPLFNHDIHFNLQTKTFDQLEGYGLLLRALLFNRYDIVNYLIQYGINKNMPYKKIFTPLTYAAYTHLDQVKFLVERGVDINATDGYGHTPLMIAAGYGRLKTVKYLIDHGADIHLKNPKGYDALLLSSKYGYFKVVKYLIDMGANLQTTNNKGDSAFLLSIRHDNLDIVKYFVEHGVDINQKDEKGYNAIMLSSYFGNMETIQYLIEKGIDLNQTDKEGLNVVDFAYKGEHLYIVQYLTKHLNDLRKDQEESCTENDADANMGQNILSIADKRKIHLRIDTNNTIITSNIISSSSSKSPDHIEDYNNTTIFSADSNHCEGNVEEEDQQQNNEKKETENNEGQDTNNHQNNPNDMDPKGINLNKKTDNISSSSSSGSSDNIEDINNNTILNVDSNNGESNVEKKKI